MKLFFSIGDLKRRFFKVGKTEFRQKSQESHPCKVCLYKRSYLPEIRLPPSEDGADQVRSAEFGVTLSTSGTPGLSETATNKNNNKS